MWLKSIFVTTEELPLPLQEQPGRLNDFATNCAHRWSSISSSPCSFAVDYLVESLNYVCRPKSRAEGRQTVVRKQMLKQVIVPECVILSPRPRPRPPPPLLIDWQCSPPSVALIADWGLGL